MLVPEGTFVIQVRSGSDLARRRLRGRIEHVVSGESEPFASLDEAIAFMSRHLAPAAGRPTEATQTTKRKGRP